MTIRNTSAVRNPATGQTVYLQGSAEAFEVVGYTGQNGHKWLVKTLSGKFVQSAYASELRTQPSAK